MITDVGAIALLTYQFSNLQSDVWGLFTNNVTITNSTVFANLTEAAWTGYARVTVGALNTATIVGGRASTTPTVQPTFTNGSAGGVTFYGWFLLDLSGNILIAAVNFGSTTIPAGLTFALTATITDKQE